MSQTLLVEIVTEEIPAGYIAPALQAWSVHLSQRLSQARIDHAGGAETFGTPRRLAIMVHDVAERQASMTEDVLGPPKAVAFDANGRPTKAAEGFAKNQGVSVKSLTIRTTDKGDYVCVSRQEKGQATGRLLQTIIPEAITAIPFPKSMRWADLGLTFARPIHAILALFGDHVVPFGLENIKSGRRTLGHRFMHPKAMAIHSPSDYRAALKSAHVIADIAERRQMIQEQITRASQRLGGKIIPDEDLLDTVTQLVEYCAVSAGIFDEAFLRLPREVLITAMREHQKYFAVASSDDRLLPCFVAVNNTPAEDMALVTNGHERVLRARLEDARFFFETDIKTPPRDMVDRLKGVLFQARLGSMFEKVGRVEKLAEALAEWTDPEIKPIASQAARLCKTDLTTQMVNEFPKLQGVMGRVYAALSGEAEATARAIEEHYLPAYAGGPLPETAAGALVSIADKTDTICGCFGIGLLPSGTADPYALRRQAMGVIQIILARTLPLSLKGLIDKGLALLGDKISESREETAIKILSFFQRRLQYLLSEKGYSKDVIAAVVSTSMDNLPEVLKRTKALMNLKVKPDFEPLAVAFKRVVNIIKKAGQQTEMATDRHQAGTDPTLFEQSCEQVLYDAFQEVKQAVSEDLKRGDFDQALLTVSTLREPVDGFFEGVMVLTEDEQQKRNRLALLGEIADLFALFADFSKIST
ncbi:MAG: glycine--tRNA ligase subunit beta [Thermodesulfobacteriota bacterium]|nr:glycine--tRNA ligase subunit beta [Thermodesulfobacteriota bacterium]